MYIIYIYINQGVQYLPVHMKLHFNVIIFGYNDIKTWEIDPVVNFDVNKLALKVDILQQPEFIYLYLYIYIHTHIFIYLFFGCHQPLL